MKCKKVLLTLLHFPKCNWLSRSVYTVKTITISELLYTAQRCNQHVQLKYRNFQYSNKNSFFYKSQVSRRQIHQSMHSCQNKVYHENQVSFFIYLMQCIFFTLASQDFETILLFWKHILKNIDGKTKFRGQE